MDWPLDDVDDVLPIISSLVDSASPFALVTIVAADGGPRAVGSQMVVTDGSAWGFLSGGCVESDVARHARDILRTWEPRRIAYGHGSPFFDIRLPCGGRIDLLLEPVRPDDPAMLALVEAARDRRVLRYLSRGDQRQVQLPDAPVEGNWIVNRLHEPAQRLVVVGSDPFALAIAAGGLLQGWQVTLVRPNGPPGPAPLPLDYRTDPPDVALRRLEPDPWTAVAIATHDADLDQAALLAALSSSAGYVGVLGSRRRLEARRARLLEAGLQPSDLARLRAPIGLPIMARSPREIAAAVVAEIIERRPSPVAWTKSGTATVGASG
ncbi:XdhC family protein [Rubellimicrobium arenae]|uniref:XdhC family protein n=1 Tax=Rubellimicrobium arenae TaxID=2817372 RepID=UPI001B311A0B|nr:XdhC family protein [Rubellimicrobium arenae]